LADTMIKAGNFLKSLSAALIQETGRVFFIFYVVTYLPPLFKIFLQDFEWTDCLGNRIGTSGFPSGLLPRFIGNVNAKITGQRRRSRAFSCWLFLILSLT
jgi:hypothetical protein